MRGFQKALDDVRPGLVAGLWGGMAFCYLIGTDQSFIIATIYTGMALFCYFATNEGRRDDA